MRFSTLSCPPREAPRGPTSKCRVKPSPKRKIAKTKVIDRDSSSDLVYRHILFDDANTVEPGEGSTGAGKSPTYSHRRINLKPWTSPNSSNVGDGEQLIVDSLLAPLMMK